MKNLRLISILLFSVSIVSCTNKEDSAGSSGSVSSPFTVKYEVRSNSNIRTSYGMPMVTYVNSTGQKQTETVSSNPWTKTITVTSVSRPLQISLLLSTSPPEVYRLWLTNSGTITQNIYVNGNLVASSTNTSSTTAISGQYDIKVIGLDYTIK